MVANMTFDGFEIKFISLYTKILYNTYMKKTILDILHDHKNNFVSGETMSKDLHISRVAISKHIKKLREEGYEIFSQTNKGYCLSDNNDVLSKSFLCQNLHKFYHEVNVVDIVSSTNDVLKQKANDLQEGFVLVADTQTSGKGRNGRSFYSPKQKGIYVSIFLKPDISIQQSQKITACVSVAIYQAIKKNYHIDSKIKWVNDIYIEDKKVSGILCEASLELNTASMEYMVVGIGMNVHAMKLPNELKDIAASIEDFTAKKVDRNQLICDTLNYFYEYYHNIEQNSFLSIYKEQSYVIFKDIVVYEKNQSYQAHVINIDENANLIIQREDKQIVKLSSGEVSILIK